MRATPHALNGLPKRLKRARTLADISARELDRLTGMCEGHTSLIESGVKPRVEAGTAAAIADALGLSLDWLLMGTGDEPTHDRVCAAIKAHEAKRPSRPIGRAPRTGTGG